MEIYLPHQITIDLEIINENMHKWLNDVVGIYCEDWYWYNYSQRNDNTKPGPVYGTVSFKNIQYAIEFKLKWL